MSDGPFETGELANFIMGLCKHNRPVQGPCIDCDEDDNVRRIAHQQQAAFRRARPWLDDAESV